jgi:hypothetical protein
MSELRWRRRLFIDCFAWRALLDADFFAKKNVAQYPKSMFLLIKIAFPPILLPT